MKSELLVPAEVVECRYREGYPSLYKKGSSVHVVSAYAGSDHFGSYVGSLSLHFCKRLFPGLKCIFHSNDLTSILCRLVWILLF
jgi:hypothetical protein